MMRHWRPFGCTYDKCESNKTFGSKNDWQRHESSQHFKQEREAWKCQRSYTGVSKERSEGLDICGECFYSREKFRMHLGSEHSDLGVHDVQNAIEASHIGNKVSSNFWCGFCKAVIPLTATREQGWNERFNHITDHLDLDRALDAYPCARWYMLTEPWTKEEYEQRQSTESSGSDESGSGSEETEKRSISDAQPAPQNVPTISVTPESNSTGQSVSIEIPPSRERPRRKEYLVHCVSCASRIDCKGY